MLLAADIGNSNITVGAFRGERLLRLWRLASDPGRTADELGLALRGLVAPEGASAVGPAQAVVYGSVVPALESVFEAAAEDYLGIRPVAVTSGSPLGIRLRVEKPSEVGVDRLLNSLAVRRLYGGPAVVVDFGTATTLDCVSARGDYLGGAILVGPGLAARALSEGTAKLPRVELRRPRRVVGRSTVECIQTGLYHGYLGMVERVLRMTLAEMAPAGKGRRVAVYVTGGLGELFAKELGAATLVPELTLQGLRLAYGILRPSVARARL